MNETDIDIPDKERSILGYLLEGPTDPIPDSVRQLIENAPESFTDGFRGSVAASIKRLMASGGAVSIAEVCSDLRGQFDSTKICDLISISHIPALAGKSAESLLKAYANRSIFRTIEQGRDDLKRCPQHARAVAATTIKTLQNIERAYSGKDGRREKLRSLEFDASKEKKPLRVIYSLAGAPISTPGNIDVIAAQAKAGKSAFVGALIASTLVEEGSDTDCFSIQAAHNPGRAVIHVDTEQPPDDHWLLVHRSMRRAGVGALPPWMHSYCFKGHSATESRKLFNAAIQEGAERHGGIFSILLDGAADLVNDVNDAEECNAFVAELEALAVKYDAPLLCVIHYNPNGGRTTNVAKTRGHLGSQLERKAETNLQIEKDGEISEVFSTRQRRAPILQGKGPKFTWRDEAGMHVSHVSAKPPSKDAERILLFLDELFPTAAGMTFSVLQSTFMKVTRKSESSAYRIIMAASKAGILVKDARGIYTRGACE